jgi:hypothetical protein
MEMRVMQKGKGGERRKERKKKKERKKTLDNKVRN